MWQLIIQLPPHKLITITCIPVHSHYLCFLLITHKESLPHKPPCCGCCSQVLKLGNVWGNGPRKSCIKPTLDCVKTSITFHSLLTMQPMTYGPIHQHVTVEPECIIYLCLRTVYQVISDSDLIKLFDLGLCHIWHRLQKLLVIWHISLLH